MTEVVNIYHLKKDWDSNPEYVYIGRAGKGKSGFFGNPFINTGDPGSTLPLYEEYLQKRLFEDPEFKQKATKLKGKKLVCFCHPKPCHGDILKRYVDQL